MDGELTSSSSKKNKSKKGDKGDISEDSIFRNWIKADGSSGFPAETNRYHLYVSLACPFAHRVLIVRKLKGLDDVLPYTVLDWLMGDKGWTFTDQKPKCSLDPVNGFTFLKEVYLKADPDYCGKFAVPVLWDTVKQTIVNNESSEIMRMLNSEFNDFCTTVDQRHLDLYPPDLRQEIDQLNDFINPNINLGVYKCGFAPSQEAYDEAVVALFNALDKLDDILSTKRYLCGQALTEADIRLFTTLIRFDWVYHGHFKCNKKRLIDYTNLWAYTRDLYQVPGIADTVDKEHITKAYMAGHLNINPSGIVSIGPDLNLDEPHGREQLSGTTIMDEREYHQSGFQLGLC